MLKNHYYFLLQPEINKSKIYERFIDELKIYAKAIRAFLKGYLPTSLLPPSKLNEIFGKVKKAQQIINRDYDIFIKWL